MKCDLPGVGVTWYYPDGIANVLSQKQIVEIVEKNAMGLKSIIQVERTRME